MNIKTAVSMKETVEEMVDDVAGQLEGIDVKMVLFFASTKYDPESVSKKMQERFPTTKVFGCTTAGEIGDGKMLEGSAVAMAFTGQAVNDAKIEVVDDPQDKNAIRTAFASFESHYNVPMSTMDPSKYVGIVLVDGLSRVEEGLMDTIGDLTNVTFIGGSAGDDFKYSTTHLYANGTSYKKGAILALLKPGVNFTCIKTQSFKNLGKTLEVTKAGKEVREVLEFNGRPAATAYAEAVGASIEEAPKHFIRNPVGLVIEGEPYVRAIQQFKGDGMVFFCGVLEGMELSLLESTDIIGDTRKAISRAREAMGGMSALINFNCALRTAELRQKNLTKEYGELFADYPTIGFSTYGEQYIGNLNQTATMLVFK